MNEATRIQLPQGFVPQGTRLSGIYEIDAPLAKGGMGEIYRGHAIETGDPVAIKLIRADMADNEAALALFRREASALNRLHHEAIVRYFVFSLDPGLQRHYLAMELVEGIALSVLIGRGPLSVADAHGLMVRVASGLHAAHERGIVHRDVSPDNFIVEDGNVTHARIIDFGIARSTRVGDATVIGSGFAGKYNYVSPEQLGLFGADVTGKSDIYSLGLVIVQCLRGKAIDMGGSQVDIIDKRRRVPDLQDIDVRMRPLLERMLAPDPLDRPASMAEVAAWELSATGRDKGRRAAPEKAPPAPRARAAQKGNDRNDQGHSHKWAIATIFGVLLLCAAGGVAWLQFSDPWKIEQPVDTPSLRPPATAGGETPGGNTTTPGGENRPTQATLPVPPNPSLDPVERVHRYIRDYDGGDCFLAMPTQITAKSAEIDAFALEQTPFNALDDAFAKAIGWEAMIDGGAVAPAQCAALRFVRQLRTTAKAQAAKLELTSVAVKAGEAMEGAFTADAPNVVLLIIDDGGKVYDASAQMSGGGPRHTFAMRLSPLGATRVQTMLLLAVASAKSLPALRPASGAASAEFFASALREAEAQAGALEVAVKYFKMQ